MYSRILRHRVPALISLAFLGATGLQAQNLLSNGGFDTDLAGWSIASAGSDQTTISWDNGTALLDRVDVTLDDNKDIIYQIIPVTNGASYQFDATWSGDLANGGDGRNWAEVMVAFVSTDAERADGTLFTDDLIQYKRAVGGPNEPAIWSSESALLSADTGPADGVFTATDNFMLVGFNLGGRDAADDRHTSMGIGYFNIDSVSVTAIGGESTWQGFTVVDGWVDTGTENMGWLYVEFDPWIYSNSLQNWFYAGPGFSLTEGSGNWIYVPAPAAPSAQ